MTWRVFARSEFLSDGKKNLQKGASLYPAGKYITTEEIVPCEIGAFEKKKGGLGKGGGCCLREFNISFWDSVLSDRNRQKDKFYE